MRRHHPDAVRIVPNEHLREFVSRIRARREHLDGDDDRTTLSPAEKTRSLKQLDERASMSMERDAYGRGVLHLLAQGKIAVDLDGRVKANYVRSGGLKKIPGLEAKEE